MAAAFGGPESLAFEDVDVPDPEPHQVRVAVRAIGVNPYDVKVYAGPGDPDRLPLRLGSEAAGVVTALGPDAADDQGPLSVGDEVIVYRTSGAYATDLVVPDTALTRKPHGLGWPEAGALLLAGATAVHTLTATAVSQGDTVLVHGASGGVGLFAVQLAALRAPAATTCSASWAPSRWPTATGCWTECAPWRPPVSTSHSTWGATTRQWTSHWPWWPTASASPPS